MTISPIFHNARPEGELPPQESAAFDLLDTLGIDYDRVSHDAAFNMELCADVSAVLGVSVCKNLFLCNRQKTSFYLLCMPPDKPFVTKDFSKLIGSSRLSFASHEDMESLLHTAPGSASILGLLFDTEHRVTVALDRAVAESEWFGCHPCRNTSSLRIRTSDVLEKLLPRTGHTPIVVDL